MQKRCCTAQSIRQCKSQVVALCSDGAAAIASRGRRINFDVILRLRFHSLVQDAMTNAMHTLLNILGHIASTPTAIMNCDATVNKELDSDSPGPDCVHAIT
eukprot:3865399-Amphidinium_carterae.2